MRVKNGEAVNQLSGNVEPTQLKPTAQTDPK